MRAESANEFVSKCDERMPKLKVPELGQTTLHLKANIPTQPQLFYTSRFSTEGKCTTAINIRQKLCLNYPHIC